MLANRSYRQKEGSSNSVGVDRSEFTPLERVFAFDEGGSPYVDEVISPRQRLNNTGGNLKAGGGHPVVGPLSTCGRESRGDNWGEVIKSSKED
jgi:hypothetical protein